MNERADAAMTPMIDVVFLLLIFFVWTASFQVVELLLPSELTAEQPAGAGPALQEEDFERIVVRVQQVNPRWQINGQSVAELVLLEQRLQQLASIRSDLPVVIDPALDVPFGQVIDVYDVARQAGMSSVQFTTQSE